MESFEAGTLPGTGPFRCVSCDYVVALAPVDELPVCPSCGGIEFSRASLFAHETAREVPVAEPEDLAWADRARERLTEPGRYLAYRIHGDVRLLPLGEWTRIGRSLAADVRFDDPTVSRRHALLIQGHDGVRVLDDRSLNGVWVNGERVEWSSLADGDEIRVGAHSLRYLDVSPAEVLREGVRESARR
jgi:FHA domain/Zinc-ribbon containing domain